MNNDQEYEEYEEYEELEEGGYKYEVHKESDEGYNGETAIENSDEYEDGMEGVDQCKIEESGVDYCYDTHEGEYIETDDQNLEIDDDDQQQENPEDRSKLINSSKKSSVTILPREKSVVIETFKRRNPHYNAMEIDRIFIEYVRFLTIKMEQEENVFDNDEENSTRINMIPSRHINAMWESHILSTPQYFDFCLRWQMFCTDNLETEKMFGLMRNRFVHHDLNSEHRQTDYGVTLEIYRIKYGDPPLVLWPDPEVEFMESNITARVKTENNTSECRRDSENQLITGRGSKYKKKALGDIWEEAFKELSQYYALNGTTYVPHNYQPNQHLGQWVNRQRQHYKKKVEGGSSPLTDEKIKMLQSLGDWNWPSKQDHAWELMFKKLRQFHESHNHCDVPKRSGRLGTWCEKQRRNYEKLMAKTSSTMTQYRLDALEALNFKWDFQDDSWETKFRLLRDYQSKHGNCFVPSGYAPNPKLSSWVRGLRAQHKRMKQGGDTRLDSYRVEQLESIGFKWIRHRKWDENIELLKEFKRENGHCLVPSRYRINQSLSDWVAYMRKKHKRRSCDKYKMPLSDAQIEELESIGFSWVVRPPNAATGKDETDQFENSHDNDIDC